MGPIILTFLIFTRILHMVASHALSKRELVHEHMHFQVLARACERHCRPSEPGSLRVTAQVPCRRQELTRCVVRLHSYLVLFLKFIASVIPTIECAPLWTLRACVHTVLLVQAVSRLCP